MSLAASLDPINGIHNKSAMSTTVPRHRPPSIAGPTFGVIKAMLGTGMLALPSGLAVITNHPHALWPAHALLVVFSILSAYTFLLYGRLTHATQATSLGDIWRKVHTRAQSSSSTTTTTAIAQIMSAENTNSGVVVSLASFVFCFGACLTFSLVFGDMFSGFLQGSLFFSQVLPAWALTRQASILAITTTILFPLCNLQSLAALAPVSVIGVIGSVLTTVFLAWRCPSVVLHSPYSVPGVGFLASVARQPSFSTYSRVQSPAPLVLLAMSCVALMAHFSAPEFYHSVASKEESVLVRRSGDETLMKKPDRQRDDDGAMGRFAKMTAVGYSVVAILNSLTLAFGFLTFGGACDGIILNNFSKSDWGANAARLLVGLSVVGSYPMLLRATRSAAFELTSFGKPRTTPTRSREFGMTAFLLSVVTAISLVVKDAGFVLSFNGALVGSNIIYTIPALLFLKLQSSQPEQRLSNGNAVKQPARLLFRAEQWLCRALVVFGVVSAVVGGATSVITTYFPHLLQ